MPGTSEEQSLAAEVAELQRKHDVVILALRRAADQLCVFAMQASPRTRELLLALVDDLREVLR